MVGRTGGLKMPEVREYMKRIQKVLGQVKAGDGIREDKACTEKKWFEVVIRELDKLSREYAHELRQETGACWNKGTYRLELEEAPPIRLLALAVVTSGWLGWVHQGKHGHDPEIPVHPDRCLEMLKSAFEFGRDLSRKGEAP